MYASDILAKDTKRLSNGHSTEDPQNIWHVGRGSQQAERYLPPPGQNVAAIKERQTDNKSHNDNITRVKRTL